MLPENSVRNGVSSSPTLTWDGAGSRVYEVGRTGREGGATASQSDSILSNTPGGSAGSDRAGSPGVSNNQANEALEVVERGRGVTGWGGEGEASSEAGFPLPASPRSCNTGVNVPKSVPFTTDSCQTGQNGVGVGLDWLTGSFPVDRRHDVVKLLKSFGICCNVQSRGFFGYGQSLRSAEGTFVTWSEGMFGGLLRPEACVSICGAEIGALACDEVLRLLRSLAEFGFNCSRIDCRLDDFDRRVLVPEVAAAVRAGDFLSFRSSRCIESSSSRGKGVTVELGKRGSCGSGKFLVCYDKFIESRGRINSIRWEMRFYGDRAREVFNCLRRMEVPAFLQAVGAFVVGNVDFRVSAGGERHKERCERYSWFESLRIAAGGAVAAVCRPVVRGLEHVYQWIKSAVAPRLALLCEAADLGAF